MSVAVIADAHIGGPGGSAEPLIDQLDELRDGDCRHLVFLGDLFHVWVGDLRFETQAIRRTVEALRELRRCGFRIDYVEGNRDFFIAGSPYSDVFDRVAHEVSFSVGGSRYLAVHGDGLNASDRLYRFWRWLSKSPVSRIFMSNLPSGLAGYLLHSLERQLAKTNFRHKTLIPEEVILRFAGERLEHGFDVVLLGHFHEPRKWQTDSGEVRLLDAWFRSKKVERFGKETG